jgi:hypothetical protein
MSARDGVPYDAQICAPSLPATSTIPSDPTGEDLAAQVWMRWGRLVLKKKIYKEAVATIRDPETKRNFDRHLARLATDSRVILQPKVKR